MLTNTTAILAGMAKAKELELDVAEAKQIAAAYANVARHYNWAVNEKAADWYNLMTAVGAIYGSKLFAMKMRREKELLDKKTNMSPAPTPVTVTPETNSKSSPPSGLQMPPAEPDYSQEDY